MHRHTLSILRAGIMVGCLVLGAGRALAGSALVPCGTVVTIGNGDVASFNPLFSNDLANARAAQLLYQPLVWVNRYGKIDYAQSIASSIAVSPDSTTYTITLKPWHWSDGTLVTAQDVVYEWGLIQQQGLTYSSYGSGGIPTLVKSIVALNPQTLQVTLTKTVNPQWFIANGLSLLQPLPAHAWKGLTLDQLYQAQSTIGFFKVTDGPMKVKTLDIGRDVIFVANPDYDGPKLHLSRLVLVFPASDGAALQQVESGELDFSPLPLEFYNVTQKLKGLHTEILSPVSFFYYLDLNYRNKNVSFFKDVRVRQALQDAIDQKMIIHVVYHGFGDPVYTPIPAVDRAMLTPAMQQGQYPVGYDPHKAIALLKEAGFTPGSDGIMQKDGKKLAFTLMTDGSSAEGMELVVMIQDEFRAVGIDMKIRQVAFGQLMAMLTSFSKSWDAVMQGTVLPPFPSGEGMFSSTESASLDGYVDPTMNKLVQNSITHVGLSGMYAYENYAAEQQPYLFLPTSGHVELVSNRIHGVDGYNDGGMIAPSALYCTKP